MRKRKLNLSNSSMSPRDKCHLNSSKFPSYIKPSRLALALWLHLDISLWENPVALTVTFQKVFEGIKGQAWITVHRCDQNRRYFFSELNRRIYKVIKRFYSMMGCTYSKRRREFHFKAIWALERDANGRYHYHLAFDLPLGVTTAQLNAWVKILWPKTHWGHREFHIKPDIDQGWIQYITKEVKNDFLDIGWTPNLQSAK